MKLANDKIQLLPFDESDLALFLDLTTNKIIMKHVANTFTHEEAKLAFIERSKPWDIKSKQWLSLCIKDVNTSIKLGSIALKISNHDAKIAEIGFILLEKAQGRGIANHALALIKDYAFNELKLNKLIAFCSVHNIGSYKLLEKQCFVREGTFQQNSFIDGQYSDDYAYGLCHSRL